MRRPEDWTIALVGDLDVEKVRERLIRWGAEVLWFREEQQTRVLVAKGQYAYRSSYPSMFKGYLFFRGIEPSALRERPGAPRVMRAETDYAFLRAARMAHLLFLIGGEILHEIKFQFIKGDAVRFQNFKATVEYVRTTSKGQSLTLSTKLLGKTQVFEGITSDEVELITMK